jgi:predicted Zn-dependent protease
VGVVRRATLIAQYLGVNQKALENAALWGSLDPKSAEPDAVLAAEMLRQGKFIESFDYSLKLLDKGYQPIFQSIAAQTAKSDSNLHSTLLERFNQAIEKNPDNSSLLLGKAVLEHFLGDDAHALRFADKAIDADQSNSGAYLLKASLLEKTGARKKATDTLFERMQQPPYDARIHLQYARSLASYDLSGAQKEFRSLVEKNPFDADLLLALAIVSKEVGDKATAKEYFEQLLFIQKHQSSAYYYLGQIGEEAGDATRALEQYRRVSDSNDYFYAMAAFCRLTIKEGNLTQCLQHLDEERARIPKEVLG